MPKDRRDIRQGLLKKGFKEVEKAKHTYYIFHDKDGKNTSARTFMSRGGKAKNIDDSIFGSMAKQCKVSNRDFLNLIDCTLSQEDYEILLKKNDKI